MSEVDEIVKENQVLSGGDSAYVENMINEAKVALRSGLAGSVFHAEKCCKNALEVDPSNYEALSIYVTILFFMNSFGHNLLQKLNSVLSQCTHEHREELRLRIGEEARKTLINGVKGACDNLMSCDRYDQNECVAIIEEVKKISCVEIDFTEVLTLNISSLKEEALQFVSDAVEKIWSGISAKYGKAGKYPGHYDWKEYSSVGIAMVILLEKVVSVLSVDNIVVCEQICTIATAVMISYSWAKTYKNGRDIWYTEYSLSNGAITKNIERIKTCLKKLEIMNSSVYERVKGTVYTTLPEVIVAREMKAGADFSRAMTTAIEESGLSKSEKLEWSRKLAQRFTTTQKDNSCTANSSQKSGERRIFPFRFR